MYGSVSNATQPSFTTQLITNWAPSTVRYLDLAQCAGLVNRKTYRSGMIYPFSIEVVPQTTCPPQFRSMYKVEVLPNTFIVRQSFKLAKEAFLKATEEEREMLKSARWNDFRVLFDDAHHAAITTGTQNILPAVVDPGEVASLSTGYEYTYISNRDSPGDDQYFGFFGTGIHVDYLPMIQEYSNSQLNRQPVPDPPYSQTIPYDSIMEQVDPEDAAALQEVNEYPPYSAGTLQTQIQTHYIGIQNGTGVTGSAVPLKTSTPILLAPCGLLRITALGVDNSDDELPDEPVQIGNTTFRINMLNGSYRGLEAGKMI